MTAAAHPSDWKLSSDPAGAGASLVAKTSERLGKMLVERQLVDAVELAYLMQKQKVLDQDLWRILLKEGLASEDEVSRLMAMLLGLVYFDIDQLGRPDPRALALFNKEICTNGMFLPLERQEGGLLVAIAGGDPDEVARIVFSRTSLRCQFVQTSFSGLARLTRHVYYFEKNPPEQLVHKEIARLAADTELIQTPAALVEHLLHWAVQARATDIHVTSGSSTKHVLFRIDGVLQPMCALPVSLGRLLGYIKLISEMDISEQRRPQDGSFRQQVLESSLTVRVSTIITEFGERAVLRLLPESHEVKDLRALGYFDEDIEVIARCMASPAGLVLITGPTGSGKSSTLHAGLCMQQLIERNVLTVEDPLEYRVPSAGQTEVNRRAGYDFGAALRHFLRHDPDVILVGEMRDAETAQAAFEAAATGHLVLSTLHVTGVFGVVPRLRPMGLVPQVIAENLLLIINQRLVRQVCRWCVHEVEYTAPERDWLGLDSTVGPAKAGDSGPNAVGHAPMARRGRGCPRCRQTGFFGRLPLYEMLPVDEDIANAIAEDVSRERLRTLAKSKGFRGIGHIAKERVRRGQTTLDEVIRVIGEAAFL